MNLIVNFVGVVAVAWGVLVARDTLVSINRCIDVAQEAVKAQGDQLMLSGAQLEVSREQIQGKREHRGLRRILRKPAINEEQW